MTKVVKIFKQIRNVIKQIQQILDVNKNVFSKYEP